MNRGRPEGVLAVRTFCVLAPAVAYQRENCHSCPQAPDEPSPLLHLLSRLSACPPGPEERKGRILFIHISSLHTVFLATCYTTHCVFLILIWKLNHLRDVLWAQEWWQLYLRETGTADMLYILRLISTKVTHKRKFLSRFPAVPGNITKQYILEAKNLIPCPLKSFTCLLEFITKGFCCSTVKTGASWVGALFQKRCVSLIIQVKPKKKPNSEILVSNCCSFIWSQGW